MALGQTMIDSFDWTSKMLLWCNSWNEIDKVILRLELDQGLLISVAAGSEVQVAPKDRRSKNICSLWCVKLYKVRV